MKIFTQIENLVKSAKSAKSLTTFNKEYESFFYELPTLGKELANLAEFQRIITYLSEKLNFNNEDLKTWKEDLEQQPEVTMITLRAMKKSLNSGRYPILEEWML